MAIVFIVMDTYTALPLGCFSSFESAKKAGDAHTDGVFSVISYNLDGACTSEVRSLYQSFSIDHSTHPAAKPDPAEPAAKLVYV